MLKIPSGKILALLLLFAVFAATSALQITLQDQRKRCLRRKIKEGETLTGQVVLSGLEEDRIRFYIEDFYGSMVYHSDNKRDFSVKYTAPREGEYKICFHSYDYFHKIVSFDFRIGEKAGHVEPEVVNEAGNLVKEAYQKMQYVLRNQGFQHAREQAHRKVMYEAEDYIKWCGGVKLVIILGVFGVQLFVLTSLFSRKKNISSMI
eukprot:TRINITY_DN3914_c0_g1_i1.p1 TRINITY_DN3914_c0_g1~~TRINITY_DN3914_c0_g1_i1.p1  ORF type:complete len:205 (-),score=45.60 TRINITY_DN3914_c0_g1_i1:180-794(-)